MLCSDIYVAPSLFTPSHLEVLDLSSNSLNGTLPTDLMRMTSLGESRLRFYL